MDGDGGAENEPLSLIVIPPASTADADAGAILVNQIPSSDSPFPSTSHSRNLSITSSNTPSNFQPSSEAEKSAQNDPVAPRNNDSKPQSDLVQIEIVKAEDAGMDLNGQVELIENSSDGMAGSSDSVGSSGDDGQEWGPDNDHEMKRVKVSAIPVYSFFVVCFLLCILHCVDLYHSFSNLAPYPSPNSVLIPTPGL